MKYFLRTLFVAIGIIVCANALHAEDKKIAWEDPKWENFTFPAINFTDEAATTDPEGSNLYKTLVPDPITFVQQHALWVAQILYWENDDYMPRVEGINYYLVDEDGVSWKSGGPPTISIHYTSRWVKNSYASGDIEKAVYETRGVLYHELTHGYQLSPRGCGGYDGSSEYWVFIEGMADAVRYHGGFFPVTNRRPGGHWMNGYQTTGFFLEWLTSKDPDFLRKFNRSAIEIYPWSFDAAMKHIFGSSYSVDGLWEEYQTFLSVGQLPEESCAPKIPHKSPRASSAVNANEAAAMAVDGNLGTKWCSTGGQKWLQLEFEQESEVCEWLVIHGGSEHSSYITSDFSLQTSEDGKNYTDVDVVTGNTENHTLRAVTPFKTKYVRLNITKPTQDASGGASRIYEFRVYGNPVE